MQLMPLALLLHPLKNFQKNYKHDENEKSYMSWKGNNPKKKIPKSAGTRKMLKPRNWKIEKFKNWRIYKIPKKHKIAFNQVQKTRISNILKSLKKRKKNANFGKSSSFEKL